MKRVARLVAVFVCSVVFLPACTSTEESEAYRNEQEAGGTLPWNRPQSWEGPGALGSQINQFSQ